MPANLENSAVATGLEKVSFHSSPKERQSRKMLTTAQLHSSHTLVKWCLKFSKPGFSITWTVNFQMFKLVLEKAEEPEIKLPTSTGSSKKQESSRKTYFCFIDYTKAFDCVDHNKPWKILQVMVLWILPYTHVTCNSLLVTFYHFEWKSHLHLGLFTFLTFKYHCLEYQMLLYSL